MSVILVAIDGSETALRALRYALERSKQSAVELHLINVQLPGRGGELNPIDEYLRNEAARALQPAQALLDAAQLKYVTHQDIGDIAPCIISTAKRCAADEIVMGTRGMSALGNLALGSIANKVVHLSPVPVTLVK